MNIEHATTEQLIDYLHGELDPARDAALLAHLESCGVCRARHEDEARIAEALRSHARASERELPPGVVARIWEQLEKPPKRSPIAWLLRPALALPLAAALVFAAFFGYVHTGQTSIDAAYYLDDHDALVGTVPFGEGNVVPTSLMNDETGADQQWISSTGASDITTNEAH
jgi:anti-sigma factor RsiW